MEGYIADMLAHSTLVPSTCCPFRAFYRLELKCCETWQKLLQKLDSKALLGLNLSFLPPKHYRVAIQFVQLESVQVFRIPASSWFQLKTCIRFLNINFTGAKTRNNLLYRQKKVYQALTNKSKLYKNLLRYKKFIMQSVNFLFFFQNPH